MYVAVGTGLMPRSSEPRAVVEEFFDRLEDDDQRHTIGELCADDVHISVPGAQFEGREAPIQMVEFSSDRYEWIKKEFGRWIETGVHVISIGALYGVDNDGNEFDGVRYIDIYEVRDGLIQRLDIYNDLAADGIVEPGK